eukprot:CAMPEP_0171492282 /NCGR_PEP_ID=MMETSP0958-20121227/4325_1 /TAXON_ID=87120 /ORGANISM="Aurantiochytrium limacinum, Strain ATCCMYA-1381" /LENGTH=106 /DNA_ID=CAMNT_0012025787 /DNA_START=214 /DNA_END=530 /DNA_ORIENTATION=-
MNIFASKRWKKVLLLTSLVTVLVGYFLGTQNEGLPSDAKSLSYMTLYGLKSYWEDKGSIQMLQKDLLQRHQPLRGGEVSTGYRCNKRFGPWDCCTTSCTRSRPNSS